jgi:Putative MetA-pathway of phenol degradation
MGVFLLNSGLTATFNCNLDAHRKPAAYPFRFHWNPFTLPLLLFSLIAASILPAAEPSADSEAIAAEQLKQLTDQTIIRSHVFLDTEWDHFKDGEEKVTWTLAGLWGWRVSEYQDWGARLKVPLAYDRSDQALGHADTVGLGDVELGTGTAFRLSNTWRMAGGIELHADTASDPALAEKVWRLKPAWGIAHDFTDWFTLTFNVEYNHSVAERHDVAPERHLELSLPGTIILPNNWSILAKYEAKIDFEHDARWIHTVNAGVAKRLSNIPIVLSATLEKPLNGGAQKLQANFTITYYFEK